MIVINDHNSGIDWLMIHAQAIGTYQGRKFKLDKKSLSAALIPLEAQGCPKRITSLAREQMPNIIKGLLADQTPKGVIPVGNKYTIWVELKNTDKTLQLSILKALSPEELIQLKRNSKESKTADESIDTFSDAIQAYKNSLH